MLFDGIYGNTVLNFRRQNDGQLDHHAKRAGCLSDERKHAWQ
jgi:hypothetical protein